MTATIDTRGLYRLPYSKNDNPNGWIEITTRCNLRCPGCYRGCHLDGHAGEHRDLGEIRDEIDRLQAVRNCHTISISGGEPLLHPDLPAVVAHVRARGMRSLLYTNGVLLDRPRLAALREAGLDGVIVRVDTLRERSADRERDLDPLRDRLLAVIRDVGGILPAFTCVLDRSNLDQAGDVAAWAARREIGFLVLIARRDFVHGGVVPAGEDSYVHPEDLAGALAGAPAFRFSAWLGSAREDARPKWLQSHRVLLDGRVLGSLAPRAVEFLQSWHHLRDGRYCYVARDRALPAVLLALASLIHREARPILRAWFGAVLRRPRLLLRSPVVQVLNAVFPPSFVRGERDFCDGCPDAVFHEGRLVPSCVLEEIKAHGRPWSLNERSAACPSP